MFNRYKALVDHIDVEYASYFAKPKATTLARLQSISTNLKTFGDREQVVKRMISHAKVVNHKLYEQLKKKGVQQIVDELIEAERRGQKSGKFSKLLRFIGIGSLLMMAGSVARGATSDEARVALDDCARKDDLDDFESLAPELIQGIEPQDEDGEDLLYLKPYSSHRVYWSRCEHREGSEIRFRPTLEYQDVKEVGNLSWYHQGEGLVCKKDIALRLLTSELLGIVVQRAEFSSPSGYPEPKDWYFVQGGGPEALKQPRMTPEPYKCWNCKKEPVCAICGFCPGFCPYCKADYKITSRKWDGKDESRLVLYPDELIVESKAWDGSDYFGPTITHRMLQFLLNCHAHPFRALPIPVDVKGATAKELKRLETARTAI